MTKSYYKYTLGFIRNPATNSVLLLNRQKKPWMGRWNGVGGKLDLEETPLHCIQRETLEETGLDLDQDQFIDCGVMRWFVDDEDFNGVHIFVADLNNEQFEKFPKTPFVYCHEGILDWKHWDWILDNDNVGIVDNIQIIFKHIFNEDHSSQDLYVAKYHQQKLTSCVYYRKGQVTNPDL